MGESMYKDVKGYAGLQCSRDGKFMLYGRRIKPIFSKKNYGNGKATARVQYRVNGVSHYIQASKAVALAWCSKYNEEVNYITYKDGDIHNISLDNLQIVSKSDYVAFKMRNAGHRAASLDERKRKLQLVIDEATLTLNYFKTLDMESINKHVSDYLYPCLMKYCQYTLHLGEKVALKIVPDCLARLYEVIINGMCIYNYERYCKKLLLNFKKRGNFGITGNVPKPIEIQVEQLNLDSLWEKYKVSYNKR